jgi:hypothetical protein
VLEVCWWTLSTHCQLLYSLNTLYVGHSPSGCEETWTHDDKRSLLGILLSSFFLATKPAGNMNLVLDPLICNRELLTESWLDQLWGFHGGRSAGWFCRLAVRLIGYVDWLDMQAQAKIGFEVDG